jgi:hypothetical protein
MDSDEIGYRCNAVGGHPELVLLLVRFQVQHLLHLGLSLNQHSLTATVLNQQ